MPGGVDLCTPEIPVTDKGVIPPPNPLLDGPARGKASAREASSQGGTRFAPPTTMHKRASPPGTRAAVAVVPAEHTRLIARRLDAVYARVAVHAVADALAALRAVDTERPELLVLDADFTTTSRGALIISRARALGGGTTIRVLSDEDYHRLHDTAHVGVYGRPLAPAYAGSQATPRVRLAQSLAAQIDGNPAQVVDLSRRGAQILTPHRLHPVPAWPLPAPEPAVRGLSRLGDV